MTIDHGSSSALFARWKGKRCPLCSSSNNGVQVDRVHAKEHPDAELACHAAADAQRSKPVVVVPVPEIISSVAINLSEATPHNTNWRLLTPIARTIARSDVSDAAATLKLQGGMCFQQPYETGQVKRSCSLN